MKSVKILMVVAAAAVLTAPYAVADTVVVKVRVPFDFVVADQHLASGEYRFVEEQEARLVRIYSESREPLAVAHWQPLGRGAQGNGRLVFHKHGGQRFLKMIRADNGSGVYLPETRLEKLAEMGRAPVAIAGMR
jgi:hypothetical protein